MIEEQVPVAPGTDARIGVKHPNDRHPERPKARGQGVDLRDDAARCSHFRGAAGRAEGALHVDDDERRAGRVEPLEQVKPPAPLDHALDDLGTHGDRVHG
jgi:hypothetical protein